MRVFAYELFIRYEQRAASEQQMGGNAPFTVSHNVGIVLTYSFKLMVNPTKSQRRSQHKTSFCSLTVTCVSFLHNLERVLLQIAKVCNIRSVQAISKVWQRVSMCSLYAPIVSVWL